MIRSLFCFVLLFASLLKNQTLIFVLVTIALSADIIVIIRTETERKSSLIFDCVFGKGTLDGIEKKLPNHCILYPNLEENLLVFTQGLAPWLAVLKVAKSLAFFSMCL